MLRSHTTISLFNHTRRPGFILRIKAFHLSLLPPLGCVPIISPLRKWRREREPDILARQKRWWWNCPGTDQWTHSLYSVPCSSSNRREIMHKWSISLMLYCPFKRLYRPKFWMACKHHIIKLRKVQLSGSKVTIRGFSSPKKNLKKKYSLLVGDISDEADVYSIEAGYCQRLGSLFC